MLLYLTKPEVEKLLFTVSTNSEKCLVQLGLSLGCRVSEIVNIYIKDIRPGSIKIWDEKKDCYRMVVCDETTDKAIQDYLDTEWRPRPYVKRKLFYFGTRTANNVLKALFKRAGLPPEKAHWHILRHTYVVQSLDAGVPLNHIVAQTGNSPNTLIKVYGMPSLELRQEMANKKAYWKVQK